MPPRAIRSAVLPLAVLGSMLIHAALLAFVVVQMAPIEALGGGGTTLEAINVEVVSAAALEARAMQAQSEPDAAASQSVAEADGQMVDEISELREERSFVEKNSAEDFGAAVEAPSDTANESFNPPKQRETDQPEVRQPEQQPSLAQPAGGAASRGMAEAGASAQIAASPGVLRRYAIAVSKALEAAKLKDKRLRRRGRATVVFVLNLQGGLEMAQLAKASGDAIVDEAALELLRRAIFPEPPAGATRGDLTYTVPVDFR